MKVPARQTQTEQCFLPNVILCRLQEGVNVFEGVGDGTQMQMTESEQIQFNNLITKMEVQMLTEK